MKRRQVIATLATLGLAIGAFSAPSALAAPAPAPAPAPSVLQSASPAATPSSLIGASAPGESIDFSVGLQPGDPAGAAAFAQAVTDPSSPSYRHFLTPAQWESRF